MSKAAHLPAAVADILTGQCRRIPASFASVGQVMADKSALGNWQDWSDLSFAGLADMIGGSWLKHDMIIGALPSQAASLVYLGRRRIGRSAA